jgi:hypothetical protein
MAHEQIRTRFRNAVAAALAKFQETADLDHSGLKGRFREIFVSDLLQQIFSSDFFAGSGIVFDHQGRTSRQADVVIFDKFHIPAILYKAKEGYFPVEGAYYVGEIKSRLTKPELLDAIEKFRHVLELLPLQNAQGRRPEPHRFLFAWSSDLKQGGIEEELARYLETDDQALKNPAATVLCVVGKGYCTAIHTPDGKRSWFKIGNADGVQEVVNFIGGIANSLIELRMQRYGAKFGHYIIPDGDAVKLHDIRIQE